MSGTSLDIDELYAWIDTIPLSRPKKNISRDFADGVLLAEVIHHFLPKYVELHNYPSASSMTQRKVNWQTLNRRVLVKVGVRISDETVQHLIDAKPGVIEQVLMEIRSRIDDLRFGKTQYRSKSQGPVQHRPCPCRGESRTKMAVIRVDLDDPRASEPGSPRVREVGPNTFEPGVLSPVHKSPSDCNHNDGQANEQAAAYNIGDIPPLKNSEVAEAFTRKPSQGYIAPPTARTISRASIRSSTSRSLKTSPSDRSDEPPAQIIYRGHKMVPLQLLDEKEKEMKLLESTNRSLTLKIFRLETLVNIKDQRVEDLTHQLQSLRAMYERATDSTLAAAGIKSNVRPVIAK